MNHFQLFVVLALAIYLSECLLYVGEDGWLLLSWGRAFTLYRGPRLHLRNPWPAGSCYKFHPLSVPPGEPPRMALAEAENRYREFLAFDKTLRLWSAILIGLGAGAFILFALRRGFWLAWGLWAFSFLFAHGTLVVTFFKGHGKLYPGQKWERLRKTALCALSPWLSSRSMDLLAEPLFRHFHPLTVGKLLLPEGSFKAWARRWLLELRYPAPLSGVPEAPILLEKTREAEEKATTQWLKESGLDPQALTAPPARTGPQDQSYCPRCDVPYQAPAGKCKDCGRDLVAFEGPVSGLG